MRTAGAVALIFGLITAQPLAAQHHGIFAHPHTNFAQRSLSARSGFGNILFPGTGGPPVIHSPTFAQRLGATVSGYYGNLPHGGHDLFLGHWGHEPVVYPVPVFYGGYWGGWTGYAPPQPQQVYVTIQQSGPPQPPVIINQYYTPPEAQPVVREYSGNSLPKPGGMQSFHAAVPDRPAPKPVVHNASAAKTEPTLYLIAFKNSAIYPAIGFWLEDSTLHYITPKGDHNQASLDLIDMELTRRLNAERGLAFELQPK